MQSVVLISVGPYFNIQKLQWNVLLIEEIIRIRLLVKKYVTIVSTPDLEKKLLPFSQYLLSQSLSQIDISYIGVFLIK